MTREEVKKQLAKNPLAWTRETLERFGHEYLKAEIKRGELHAEYRIFYDYERLELKRVSLYFMVIDSYGEGGECVVRKFDNFPTLEEVKEKAEAHRLDLLCQLLCIKD